MTRAIGWVIGGFIASITMRRAILVAVTMACFVLGGAAADAAPQPNKPTLYVDQIEEGKGEVFLTYSYMTGFLPSPEDVLEVAGPALASRRSQ